MNHISFPIVVILLFLFTDMASGLSHVSVENIGVGYDYLYRRDPAYLAFEYTIEAMHNIETKLDNMYEVLSRAARNIVETGKTQEVGEGRKFLEVACKYVPDEFAHLIPSVQFGGICYHEHLFKMFMERFPTPYKFSNENQDDIIFFQPYRVKGATHDLYLWVTTGGEYFWKAKAPDIPCFQYIEENLDSGRAALEITPSPLQLKSFPSWKSRTENIIVRNTGESAVRLLQALASRNWITIDFQPCMLAPGEEVSLTVTIPANSFVGEFNHSILIKAQAISIEAGASDVNLDRIYIPVSGRAIPPVNVLSGSKVNYLGLLKPDEEFICSFQLTPAIPEMKLRLLPSAAPDCVTRSELIQDENGGCRLELHITPDQSRSFHLVQRFIAIDGAEELPPLEIKVKFGVVSW